MDQPKTLKAAILAGATAALALSCAISGDWDEDPRPIHERLDMPSVAACGGCHQEVYQQWSESLHHGAWTNANVLAATGNFTRQECRPCHSPMPVLATGLDVPPEYREFNREDGVHCLSCHGLEDGVAAARTLPDAPCRPRYEPRLMQAELCYPCHEPTHQAFQEYHQSDAYALQIRCVDCHMQPLPSRGGAADHGPNGGFNPEFVKRALAWDCRIVDGAVLVKLRNRCGHKFPGEIPSRAFLVRVDFAGHAPVYELLRKPHKGEDRADNRLLPDEQRVLRFPLPEGVREASVRLLFNPLPLWPEEQAFVLGSWRGSL
jgi:hypothetical protein